MLRRPTERLDVKAKTAWRVRGIITAVVYAIIIIAFYVSRLWLDFLPGWPGALLVGFFLVLSVLSIFVIPPIRMVYWGYQIREEDIDIQSGIIVIKRVLIPMNRVQHVDLEYGPIMRHFKLATLVITTAGSNHKIPAISQETAMRLRAQIASLVYESDDDV